MIKSEDMTVDVSQYVKRVLTDSYAKRMITKLVHTMEKHANTTPEMENLERELRLLETETLFEYLIEASGILNRYRDGSQMMDDLSMNFYFDIIHGVNKDMPRRKGKYYTDHEDDEVGDRIMDFK